MSTPDSWRSVTLHLSFFLIFCFSSYSSTSFFIKKEAPVKLLCCVACVSACTPVFFLPSPTWCSWAWRIQAVRLCGASAAVVAAVHNVLSCQPLSSVCSWRIGVKLLAQLPLYLWSWSSLVTQPGGRESVIPSNPREINYSTSLPLWFLSTQCLANTSKVVDVIFYNLQIRSF